MNIQNILNSRWLEFRNIYCSGKNDSYLHRWKLTRKISSWFKKCGNIYIHNFKRPDVAIFHDHPWDFCSIILAGHYTEYRPGEEPLRRGPGSIVFRPAEAAHYVDDLEDDVWTLVIRGPRRRTWGFWTDSGWIDWKSYLNIPGNSRAAIEEDDD